MADLLYDSNSFSVSDKNPFSMNHPYAFRKSNAGVPPSIRFLSIFKPVFPTYSWNETQGFLLPVQRIKSPWFCFAGEISCRNELCFILSDSGSHHSFPRYIHIYDIPCRLFLLSCFQIHPWPGKKIPLYQWVILCSPDPPPVCQKCHSS